MTGGKKRKDRRDASRFLDDWDDEEACLDDAEAEEDEADGDEADGSMYRRWMDSS